MRPHSCSRLVLLWDWWHDALSLTTGLRLLLGPAISAAEAGDGSVTGSLALCMAETNTIVDDEAGLEITFPSQAGTRGYPSSRQPAFDQARGGHRVRPSAALARHFFSTKTDEWMLFTRLGG